LPFRYSDLERLTLIGEHLSAVLENALLYQEIRRQKTLAETLLQAIPIGIVAVAETGRVRWFNQAAQRLLDMPAERALGQPVETLGSRAADMIRRALQDEAAPPTKEWSDPLTKRDVSVQVRRLQDGGSCFGVMALIRDVTDEKRLQEKQNELDRARFWTQLAAAMSHEIRNPLVAISTFAQLLPERHEDPEFREEFSRIVQREVASLNAIIEQVHAFAHPASPAFRPLNLRQVVQKAVGTVSLKRDPSVAVEIETSFPPDLPDVQGDEQALTQCMVHLLDNALEAVSGVSKPKVRISGRRVGENGLSHVEISVSDNGAGIADDIRPRLFSPFCTTKTKGLGLGLPIVKRTLLDHSGDVQVDSGADGTTVTISIPALEPKETP
jgi:two-component system sensor histidine kinase AtoS